MTKNSKPANDATPTKADETHRYGGFPSLPGSIGMTDTLQDAVLAFRITDAECDIACFDGAPGAGKTTAASFVIEQSGRDWRYCRLPQAGSRRDLLEAVYRAVFRRQTTMTASKMFDALVERLMSGDIGVIADEAHHLGVSGIQQLRYLWDEAALHNARFPLLLVGYDLSAELDNADEVRRRIRRWVYFEEYLDTDTATIIAAALHPRLAVTKPAIIKRLNEGLARRSIGNWETLAIHIKYLDTTDPTGTKVTGLDEADVRRLGRLGKGGKAA
jgi:hypothetical protein